MDTCVCLFLFSIRHTNAITAAGACNGCIMAYESVWPKGYYVLPQAASSEVQSRGFRMYGICTTQGLYF